MRRERGAVLVITLGVLAIMVAIVVAIAADQRVDLRAQIRRTDARRAKLAAEAGVQRALAELQLYLDEGQVQVASLADEWALLGNRGADSHQVADSSFRLEIVDASGLINLNTASQQVLERLPLTTEQIDSLLDWRSPEMQPRPEGAKDEYYNNLPNPYNAKLRRFESVDELLLVKGFTPSTLYEVQEGVASTGNLAQGPDGQTPVLADVLTVDSQSSNQTPDGQAKLNVNTVQQQQLVQRGIPANVAQAIIQRRNTQGTFTRLGDVLRVPGVTQANAAVILDNLWINGSTTIQGRINVNTAGEAVLNSLPNMEPDIASAIVGRQSTGFTSLSELLDVPGFTLQMMQDSVDFLTVGTQTFQVRVIGTSGDTSVALLATVMISGQTLRLLKIEEMPFNDMWSRWTWEQETTNEVVVSED